MKNWICILILATFATFAIHGGMFAAGDKTLSPIPFASEMDNAGGNADIAKSTSRCCMDELTKIQSGTSRCSSDCAYAITSEFILTLASVSGSRQNGGEAVWPRNTGTVFRPPIA